jgi:hypothetical protein
MVGDGAHVLEGVWRFEKEVDTRPDGTPVDIPAPEFEGMLIYRADGFMSVNLMPKGRTWTTESATLDELRSTVAEGTGYAGRYEVDEKQRTVTHIVSVSLDPANEGRRLVRQYAFEGQKLVLSGEWTYKGAPLLFHVTWERMPPPADSSRPAVPSAGTAPFHPVTGSPPPVRVFRRTPDGGTVRTALLTVPETSMPYIGIALAIDGRVRYFKAPYFKSPPAPSPPGQRSIGGIFSPFQPWVFGEEVVLYGGDTPTRIVRENGEVYNLEPSESSTTRMFFSPKVVLTGYETPKPPPLNPHPEAFLEECRYLTDPFEHDVCLHYQAGRQNDERLCKEMMLPERAALCRTWLANIRDGRINK